MTKDLRRMKDKEIRRLSRFSSRFEHFSKLKLIKLEDYSNCENKSKKLFFSF